MEARPHSENLIKADGGASRSLWPLSFVSNIKQGRGMLSQGRGGMVKAFLQKTGKEGGRRKREKESRREDGEEPEDALL